MSSVENSPQPSVPVFPTVNAWRQLLELTIRDVKGTASPAISRHLRLPENLVPWYRAITVVRQSVETQIGDSRARLKALAAELSAASSSGQPGQEYLAAKATHDVRLASRLRFHQTVKARQTECIHLMGAAGVDRNLTAEGLLALLMETLDLLEEDDVAAARSKLAGAVRHAQSAMAVR